MRVFRRHLLRVSCAAAAAVAVTLAILGAESVSSVGLRLKRGTEHPCRFDPPPPVWSSPAYWGEAGAAGLLAGSIAGLACHLLAGNSDATRPPKQN